MRIPRSFLGFSAEWPTVPYLTGTPSLGGVSPVFTQIMRNISVWGNGAPGVRVGGVSSDSAWWNPNGAPWAPGIYFNVTPDLLTGIAASARLTRAPYIFGLNLAQNNPEMAASLMQAIRGYVPYYSVRSFEIGNEPEFFPYRVFLRSGYQVVGYTRPMGWGYTDYQREFAAYVARLRPLTYGPRLSGPSAFGAWGKNAASFARTFHSAINMVTAHSYALSACDIQGRPFARTDPRYPSAVRLLSSGALFSGLGNAAAAGRAALPYRLPVRFTETNSIACGGKDGVSNAMPAALWGLDFMMLYAQLGLSGMDFHTAPLYGPIFNGIGAPRELNVNPLYYAMLMFSEATAYGARFLTSVPTTQRTSYGFNARMWGTLNYRHTARIVALNKSLSRTGFATVRIPGARAAGYVTRLLAPNPYAKTGITLAGRRLSNPTYTGGLYGVRRATRLVPHNGVYTFFLPRSSAALVTIPGVPLTTR